MVQVVVMAISICSSATYIYVTVLQIRLYGWNLWKRYGAGVGRDIADTERDIESLKHMHVKIKDVPSHRHDGHA